MQDKPTRQEQNPADIAREAFRRLAMRRIAPTPDAYREIYDEVAGMRDLPPAEKILSDLAARLARGRGELALFAHRFTDAVKTRDWDGYGKQLDQLVAKYLETPEEDIRSDAHAAADKQPASGAKSEAAGDAAPSPRKISIPLVDDPEPPARKIPIPLVDDIPPAPARKLDIPLVDDSAPAPSRLAPIPLVDDEPALQAHDAEQVPETTSPRFNDTQMTRMLREMLVRALTLPIPTLLQGAQELSAESEALATAIGGARNRNSLAELEPRFKQLCFRVELKSGDMAEERELLLRLFRLLIENVGELVEDDSWLSGQIAVVQNVLSGPINYATLIDATTSLKEVIYKQSMLKHSLAEAKRQVKNMVLTVIDRLGSAAANTGDYQRKIELYTHKIASAKGAAELNSVLDQVMHDTRIAQIEAQRSHDDVLAARQEVQAAETRIHELEVQLEQMSELAHEDQLTGSLNRRGLDEVLEREMERAERKQSPLCVALLDLDNFKKLNDTLGHSAGDSALVHLVQVVKDTLRAMDIIARFGGEEFLIVLPHTPLEEAAQTLTRVQRELTKRIFMHNNEKILITFSAGVAQRKPGEEQAALIERADKAAYQAKRAGKNRVVVAD